MTVHVVTRWRNEVLWRLLITAAAAAALVTAATVAPQSPCADDAPAACWQAAATSQAGDDEQRAYYWARLGQAAAESGDLWHAFVAYNASLTVATHALTQTSQQADDDGLELAVNAHVATLNAAAMLVALCTAREGGDEVAAAAVAFHAAPAVRAAATAALDLAVNVAYTAVVCGTLLGGPDTDAGRHMLAAAAQHYAQRVAAAADAESYNSGNDEPGAAASLRALIARARTHDGPPLTTSELDAGTGATGAASTAVVQLWDARHQQAATAAWCRRTATGGASGGLRWLRDAACNPPKPGSGDAVLATTHDAAWTAWCVHYCMRSLHAARTFIVVYVEPTAPAMLSWLDALLDEPPPLPLPSLPLLPLQVGVPLRVLYVGPDFRQHAVLWSLGPTLAAHNRRGSGGIHAACLFARRAWGLPLEPASSPLSVSTTLAADVRGDVLAVDTYARRADTLSAALRACVAGNTTACAWSTEPAGGWWHSTVDAALACTSFHSSYLWQGQSLGAGLATLGAAAHVMVDLAGMTRGGVVEHLQTARVAPVQLHYLGSPIPPHPAAVVDWTVTDAVATVVEEVTADATAVAPPLLLLPPPFHPSPWVVAKPPPAGAHTLCTHSRAAVALAAPASIAATKRDSRLVAAWAGILTRMQGAACLVVVVGAGRGADGSSGDRDAEFAGTGAPALALRAALAAHGVPPAWLVLAPAPSRATAAAWYARISLVLDTRTYGAHSTAADTLAHGVPLLLLAGASPAQRVGVSLLTAAHAAAVAAGCPHTAAALGTVVSSLTEYADVAVRLARRAFLLQRGSGATRPPPSAPCPAPLFSFLNVTRALEAGYLAAAAVQAARGGSITTPLPHLVVVP